MTKLAQKTVDDGCMAAYERYATMTEEEAKIVFAFELQGWAKYMVTHGASLGALSERIIQLLDLLIEANPEV